MKSRAREHRPQLVQSQHVRLEHHGAGAAGRVNAAVAMKVSGLLSSMWFFWLCVLLDVAQLYLLLSGRWALAALLITFLAQTVIQLLALPVLGVMASIQQRASDARAEADHATLTAIHGMTARIDEMQETQLQILQRLDSGRKD